MHDECAAFSLTRPPTALSVAGTDPSGGAGIQADLKTFTARGVMGASIITALVAQNTHGVSRVEPVATDFVAAQFASVLDDMAIDASKTGMLGSRAMVERVLAERAMRDLGFLTVDPVLAATSGQAFLTADALDLVRRELLPAADLITPNLPEAARLLGDEVPEASSLKTMLVQADELLARGARAVLLKGGHGAGATVLDVLVTARGLREVFRHPRIDSRNTHGTGCTLSAAITAEVAKARHRHPGAAVSDAMLRQAVERALDYLARAIGGARHWSLSLNPEGAHGQVNHQVDIQNP